MSQNMWHIYKMSGYRPITAYRKFSLLQFIKIIDKTIGQVKISHIVIGSAFRCCCFEEIYCFIQSRRRRNFLYIVPAGVRSQQSPAWRLYPRMISLADIWLDWIGLDADHDDYKTSIPHVMSHRKLPDVPRIFYAHFRLDIYALITQISWWFPYQNK